MGTIREAYARASSFLHERRVEDSGRNAELLLQHLLQVPRSRMLACWSDPFPEELEEAWERLLMRRAAGEPLQYIVGEQEFYGLPFEVGPSVLIPRPETELLVEQVLQKADRLFGEGTPVRAADIGTGSGCIAVTLAKLRPSWRVTAVDLSPAALEVAKRNAKRNDAAVRFLEGSWLDPLLDEGEPLDVLVSNPPYIPGGELPLLQREVREYEPHSALDGGADGMDPYRTMAEQARLGPVVPRLVAFEVGIRQAESVRDMLRQTGLWSEDEIVPDLAGIPRHVLAWRK